MDYKRVFLWVSVAFVGMLLWNDWQADYPPPIKQKVIEAVENNTSIYPDLGSEVQRSSVSTPQTKIEDESGLVTQTAVRDVIHVKTDLVDVTINTVGGEFIGLKLLDYPQSVDTPDLPVKMFNMKPKTRYVAQSGLLGTNSPDSNGNSVHYSSDQTSYTMSDDEDSLKVNLYWKNDDGVKFTKTFTFKRGNYAIDVDYNVDNATSSPWKGSLVTQLSRTDAQPVMKGLFKIHAYFGASISTPDEPYDKISFKKMNKANVSENAVGGWAAMQQHYFLSAWVPEQAQDNHYYSRVSDDGMYTIGIVGPEVVVAPNSQSTLSAQLYAGPELQEQLKTLAPHLELTIDYGFLWFISDIIFWLMQHIFYVVGNWGWAIVLVTLLIKLSFYKLSAKSYRSMAGMRKMQPKILALKERFADDKQKLSQATMELYKKEKINPLGGCLPILIQIPVFIALYWVLVESVQLRQAPFILWIQDLSVKDPFYVLPVLMGISMFIQQRLNPPPPDPTQAKIMMLLPVVFTILFLNFPAGLILYWFVNNSLSIIQQWYVMKTIDNAPTPRGKQSRKKLKQKT